MTATCQFGDTRILFNRLQNDNKFFTCNFALFMLTKHHSRRCHMSLACRLKICIGNEDALTWVTVTHTSQYAPHGAHSSSEVISPYSSRSIRSPPLLFILFKLSPGLSPTRYYHIRFDLHLGATVLESNKLYLIMPKTRLELVVDHSMSTTTTFNLKLVACIWYSDYRASWATTTPWPPLVVLIHQWPSRPLSTWPAPPQPRPQLPPPRWHEALDNHSDTDDAFLSTLTIGMPSRQLWLAHQSLITMTVTKRGNG